MSSRISRPPEGFLVTICTNSALIEAPAQAPRASQGLAMSLNIYGELRPNEVQRFSYRGAELYVFGHCLRSPEWMQRQFAAVINSRRIDAVAGWPGSYAAVVGYDEGVRVYSDVAGQFALYYGLRDREVLVSSDPVVIATLHDRLADPVTIAARIGCPDVLPMWSGRSPFKNVHRLEAGGILQLTHRGPRVQPYLTERGSHASDTADAVAALRSGLLEGVRARCDGRFVSTDFSGGLDSSSIAFLAARHAEVPLPALVYYQSLAPAADLADAQRCARLSGALDLMVVRGGEDTLPFASLADAYKDGTPLHDAIPRHAEPAPGALIWRAPTRRLLAAAARHSELHFTGEGGDALLMAAPSYLASLVRRGSYRTLMKHCGAYGRLRNTSPLRIGARATRLAWTSHRRALHLLAAELENRQEHQPVWGDAISWWASCGETTGWLTTQIRQQLAMRAGDQVTIASVRQGTTPADLAAKVQLRNAADAQRQLRDLGRDCGLPVHAPFLDGAVVSAVMSIPAANRADPWTYKPMLRSGVNGLVPEEVLSRQTKGDYSAEDYIGARRAMPALRALLRDPRLADLGIIEPKAVASTLRRMSAGVAVPLGALNMLLATELWLRATEDDINWSH